MVHRMLAPCLQKISLLRTKNVPYTDGISLAIFKLRIHFIFPQTSCEPGESDKPTANYLSYGYHTLQPTNMPSKSKIGKTDGSASSTYWYAVLLEWAHKQNWPATSKSKSVCFCWLNCLPSWHKLWYYYFITKFEFVFHGLFFPKK